MISLIKFHQRLHPHRYRNVIGNVIGGDKLENLKDIKDNPDVDHVKQFNIDESVFDEIKGEATVILNILNGTSAPSSARTMSKIQKGNIFLMSRKIKVC